MGAAFTALASGLKKVAKGKVQSSLGMQSPQLASGLVRIGRFFYSATFGWLAISWYTGYVNERTSEGEGAKFILPSGTQPVISAPDRKDKSLPGSGGGGSEGLGETLLKGGEEIVKGVILGVNYQGKGTAGRKLIAISPEQLGVPGSALAGYLWTAPNNEKQKPPYEKQRYTELLQVASRIGHAFGLRISSGYRPESTGSLHGSGLAFDLVGTTPNLKRAATWCAKYPGMFQEIFVHNEGSGIHLHIGFYPDAGKIFAESDRYARSARTQSVAPAASPLTNT